MISSITIALNEEKYIARMLKSILPYVEEAIVLDGGSTDRTVEIAKECGAIVKVKLFEYDFAKQRNWARVMAHHSWILAIDCDEILEPELGEHLPQLLAMAKQHGHDCFAITEKNIFTDTEQCDCPEHQPKNLAPDGNYYWNYPDYHNRLFRNYCYWEGYIHETVVGMRQPPMRVPGEWGGFKHLKTHDDQKQSDDLYYTMRPQDYPKRLQDDAIMKKRILHTPQEHWISWVKGYNPSKVGDDNGKTKK
jgi:glycosyltransferase involved in cell wall biosynthesis